MQILFFALAIAAVYFFLVFVVLRLVVPFMGFAQYNPPTNLPPEIKQAVADLENKSHNSVSYLQAVYDFIMEKNRIQWKHSRFLAGTRLDRLFVKELKEIWDSQDFVYCQAINFVVFTLLANSKFFKAGDIKVQHTFLNFVLHQYLKVKVGDNWMDVDPAGSGIRGFGIGHHASFFG